MKPARLPESKKSTHKDVIQGISVPDPYRWLEDDTKKVSTWVNEQNEHTQDVLNAKTNANELKKRLEKIVRVESCTIMVPRNGRYFYTQQKPDQDHAILFVKEDLNGEGRVLLDPNTLSNDKSITLSFWKASLDGKYVAYQLSEAGNDKQSIHIIDVDTGEPLSDLIPDDIYPSMQVWSHDGNGFWYTRQKKNIPKGEEKFHRQIYYHKIGEDISKDQYVFGEEVNKEDFPIPATTNDDRYLIVQVYVMSTQKVRDDIYILDRKKSNNFKKIINSIDARFVVRVHRNKLYFLTDYKATNWRLIACSLESCFNKNIDDWEEVIPEDKFVLENVRFVGDTMFVERLRDATSVVETYSLDGDKKKTLDLPIGSVHGFGAEEEGSEFFFAFTSYVVRKQIFRYDTEKENLEKYFEIRTMLNSDDIEVSQKWFKSKDGTKVPMFIVHKKGIKYDGKNPTLVYGYGGYGISVTPSYTDYVVPFIEDGGVYIVVTLRGGGEFGEEWHTGGNRKNKQNSFNDCISAIEYLINQNITTPEKVANPATIVPNGISSSKPVAIVAREF